MSDEERVVNARWQAPLEAHPRLLAVSVHHKLRAEGFVGSYPTVVRQVHQIRGPRFKAAAAVSVPIYTDPGEEAQFDFCDLDDWGCPLGLGASVAVLRGDLVLVVVVHHL